MTTETTCWSSIWQTDDTTKEYFVQHGRPEAYKELKPADVPTTTAALSWTSPPSSA